jgi:NADH-quinone oxidoreductase subunit A
MLWPLLLYFGVLLVVLPLILLLSHVVGERHRERATVQPYESGIMTTGSMPLRFPASYYLVAMMFVIFDLESVFLFAWAIAGRELGWGGYFPMLFFVVALVIMLVYVWRIGALDWRTPRQRRDLQAVRHGRPAAEAQAAPAGRAPGRAGEPAEG